MTDEKTNFNTIVIDAGTSDSRHSQIDGGRRPGPSSVDARRIAELELEVQELRRANEILKVYFAKELDLGLNTLPSEVGVRTPIDTSGTEVVTATPVGAIRWAPSQPPQLPSTPQPMAEFRALGPIEAVVAGRLVDLGAPKQRALLALLISKVGQPVAVDVIVEELWTGNPHHRR